MKRIFVFIIILFLLLAQLNIPFMTTSGHPIAQASVMEQNPVQLAVQPAEVGPSPSNVVGLRQPGEQAPNDPIQRTNILGNHLTTENQNLTRPDSRDDMQTTYIYGKHAAQMSVESPNWIRMSDDYSFVDKQPIIPEDGGTINGRVT